MLCECTWGEWRVSSAIGRVDFDTYLFAITYSGPAGDPYSSVFIG